MPADEQQTGVLPATGEQSVSAEAQPAPTPDSPGARWATGATEEPASKETTKELEVAAAPTAAEATDQPTPSEPRRLPVRDLPAGLDPGELTFAPPGSARRGKLRRRLRYLRGVRELLLRDLGGFTYEIHRTAPGTPQEGHRKLADAKANRIAALDAEVGAIEARLGVAHVETVLREPGIGGTCPECGELYASDARFCAHCGLPFDAKARALREASIAAAAQPTPEPQPASVLWAGGPRPAAGREAEEKAEQSEVTSRWLLGGEQQKTPDSAAQPDTPTGPGADEPVTADEPGAPEKPAPPAEPGVREQQSPETAANDPAAPEPTEPGPVDEPSGTETDAPKADQPAPAEEPGERRFEPGPNGRPDDDVGSSLTGDPLTSRRGEQGP